MVTWFSPVGWIGVFEDELGFGEYRQPTNGRVQRDALLGMQWNLWS